jgi:DNA repair photolyase
MLHLFGIGVRILTKGGMRSIKDFDLLTLTHDDAYGATLTFLDDEDSKFFEPNAALPDERIDALKLASKSKIYTWASLEPVIDPIQTLEIILATREFVDEYKVGKWNYDARAKEIDWNWFGHKAVELLEKYGKKYYIKEDLREAMR